jgi:hypothetical protein
VVIAAVLVAIVAAIFIFTFQHGGSAPKATPANAPLDPYAASLQLSNLAMSQSTNYIGARITYLEGHIVKTGDRTVTGIGAQVLFRDYTNLITQNTTQAMNFIRTRQPYVDVEPVSAAPLAPGQGRDFRLVFDGVSPQWNGQMPQLRIIHVQTR